MPLTVLSQGHDRKGNELGLELGTVPPMAPAFCACHCEPIFFSSIQNVSSFNSSVFGHHESSRFFSFSFSIAAKIVSHSQILFDDIYFSSFISSGYSHNHSSSSKIVFALYLPILDPPGCFRTTRS